MTYDIDKLIGKKLIVVDVTTRPIQRTEYTIESARPYRSMKVIGNGSTQEIFIADAMEGWEDLANGYPTWIHFGEVMCYLDPSS